MREYEKHIRRTDDANQGPSWCGAPLGPIDWTFTGLDHAANSLEKGTKMLPCRRCINAAVEAMAKGYGFENWKQIEATKLEVAALRMVEVNAQICSTSKSARFPQSPSGQVDYQWIASKTYFDFVDAASALRIALGLT